MIYKIYLVEIGFLTDVFRFSYGLHNYHGEKNCQSIGVHNTNKVSREINFMHMFTLFYLLLGNVHVRRLTQLKAVTCLFFLAMK